MKQRLLTAIARIDALPQRDRMVLAGGLIAAAIGLQALWLLPLHDKRVAILQSVAEEDRSRVAALAEAAQEKNSALQVMREHNTGLEHKLATLGLKATQREPVASFVTRTLHSNGVRLAALTALPVQELSLPVPAGEGEAAAPTAAPTTSAAPGAASAPAATAAPTLFRHRAEVRLEGPVQGVLQALDQLERELIPLRVERVRLAPSGTAGVVQASVVLTTISEERTWLAL